MSKSKIANIRKHVEDGKGSLQMMQYLLEYIDSLERENKHLWDNYSKGTMTGHALPHISAANIEKINREKNDASGI